ncbi:ubiquinol-cytochrome C chaperone family protein [Sphingomonas sp. TX0543]|uniref:ubiquinol-cytochrome C chaperone family protein n=1 Tax=unclassified Sphingomonas TaxID=196159 RepID=UPI00201686EA|nr:ubiquinol-cytochrome C chaperone family protein [Sphingomonas sp. 3P27F8]
MGFLDRFRKAPDAEAALPLYQAVVARARQPHWYLAGAVPDTLDGRFDMVAAITAFVLMRLEDDPAAAALVAHLTERFIDDMDAQVRQIGFGDMVVGKHVGRMMGMLGGRLGAYREGVAEGSLDAALARNLYRGDPPAPEAVAHVREGLLAFHAALKTAPLEALERGELP